MTGTLALVTLTVAVLARCVILAVSTALAPDDTLLLGLQPLRVVDAFRHTGPDPNSGLADDLFHAMVNGQRADSSPAAMMLHGLLGSQSILLRIAPLATLQSAAAVCEAAAAVFIVVAFGNAQPFFTAVSMLCIAVMPAQSVDEAFLMALYAMVLGLMTFEPLPPTGAILAALSVGLTFFNPYAGGLVIAVVVWSQGGSKFCRVATSASLAAALAVFNVTGKVRMSLFDMRPHQGNSWLMYQLLFPRFQHAFAVVALIMCLACTAIIAVAIRDRGTPVMPVQIAAVAVTARVIFQPVTTLADVFIALAFLGATPQAYRIRYGFLAVGTIVVTTPLAYAYRFAWLQIGSMPQPNMAFYGNTVHQLAVALLLNQYMTRIAAEARTARELREDTIETATSTGDAAAAAATVTERSGARAGAS